MGTERTDIIRGTLDMLILKVVSLEPMHGWGISERIQLLSGDALRVQQGSLYEALHRLTREGWLAATWGPSENGRRAKFYRLTPEGERQLVTESAHWDRLSMGVARILASRA